MTAGTQRSRKNRNNGNNGNGDNNKQNVSWDDGLYLSVNCLTCALSQSNSNQSNNNEDGSIEVKVQITLNSVDHPIFSSGKKSDLIRCSQNHWNSNGE
jgi:hypothetical protein